MKQKRKPLGDALSSISAFVLLFGAAFLLVSLLFVTAWDWSIVPLFHAPFAPFTAGMGMALVLSLVVGLYELVRER
jgi:hypothetical protein